MSDADAIRAAVSCEEYIGRYVTLKKGVGLCPFHEEKTPSFRVHPGYYKCFGCGAAGDVINFAMRLHGINFGKSIRLLAGEYGVVPVEAPSRYAVIQRDRLAAEVEEWWPGYKRCEYATAAEIIQWYESDFRPEIGAEVRARIRGWAGFEVAMRALCI